jgi:hypothetical protein
MIAKPASEADMLERNLLCRHLGLARGTKPQARPPGERQGRRGNPGSRFAQRQNWTSPLTSL